MRSNRSWLNFFNGNEPEDSPAPKKPQIIESNDIADVLKYYEREKWLILDLDNTVIEPEDEHEELGSDQWFGGLLRYAAEIDLNENGVTGVAYVITIYAAVQHHLQLKLIQPEIVDIIKLHMALGNPVLFLTARGSEICEPTLRQLKRHGIDLTEQWGDDIYVMDIGDGDIDNAPVFVNGGVFCSGKPKEKCLKTFLDLMNLKPNVLMVDDKKKYLDAVIQMVQEYGGTAAGLRYGRLDEKVQQHDFARANEKLIELKPKLPTDAQEAMVKLRF